MFHIFYFCNLIIEVFDNLIKSLKNFLNINTKKSKNININSDINIQIELFLKELYENWKNKNINNIDITYDILNLFLKYKKDNLIHINNDNNNENNNDMKYYTLGWYIYQCIENK